MTNDGPKRSHGWQPDLYVVLGRWPRVGRPHKHGVVLARRGRLARARRATGPVSLHGKIPDNESVFSDRMSALVYLVWSTISLGRDGSAFNSVTAVPLQTR